MKNLVTISFLISILEFPCSMGRFPFLFLLVPLFQAQGSPESNTQLWVEGEKRKVGDTFMKVTNYQQFLKSLEMSRNQLRVASPCSCIHSSQTPFLSSVHFPAIACCSLFLSSPQSSKAVTWAAMTVQTSTILSIDQIHSGTLSMQAEGTSCHLAPLALALAPLCFQL